MHNFVITYRDKELYLEKIDIQSNCCSVIDFMEEHKNQLKDIEGDKNTIMKIEGQKYYLIIEKDGVKKMVISNDNEKMIADRKFLEGGKSERKSEMKTEMKSEMKTEMKNKEMIEIEGQKYFFIDKINVYWCGWECDTEAWLIEKDGVKKVVISNHGKKMIADREFLENKLEEYRHVASETQRFLDAIE